MPSETAVAPEIVKARTRKGDVSTDGLSLPSSVIEDLLCVPTYRQIKILGGITKDLGAGTYGKVRLADVQGQNSGEESPTFRAAMKTEHKGKHGQSLTIEALVVNYLHNEHPGFYHPNIVHVSGIVCEDNPITRTNVCALALDYYDRGCLHTFVRHKHVSEPLRWCFGLEIVTGLLHAHDNGVGHCDLKPDNVLIGRRKRAVVADWGMARKLGPCETPLAALHYRAPEVQRFFDRKRRVDGSYQVAPVDVWALGTLLLFLCANKTVCHEHYRTKESFRRHANQLLAMEVPDMHRVALAELSFTDDQHRWAAVIHAALNPNPEERATLRDLRALMVTKAREALADSGFGLPNFQNTMAGANTAHWKRLKKYLRHEPKEGHIADGLADGNPVFADLAAPPFIPTSPINSGQGYFDVPLEDSAVEELAIGGPLDHPMVEQPFTEEDSPLIEITSSEEAHAMEICAAGPPRVGARQLTSPAKSAEGPEKRARLVE